MYLGSRPAASLARRSTRPEVLFPGIGVTESSAGWPIHHSPCFKHKHRLCVSSPSLRGVDDMVRSEKPSFVFSNFPSLTEYQHWPKSEFETAEDDPWNMVFGDTDSITSHPSEWSFTESAGSVFTKKESGDGTGGSKSDDMCGGDDEVKSAQPLETDDFLEKELVYNRHAHEMNITLPVRSTISGRQIQRQTASSVCRTLASRRRVHPVGKFTDELVNWIPENGTDDEKEADDDGNDGVYMHCIESPKCNGSHVVPVHVKQSKRTNNLSKHPAKRKRSHFAVERKEGGYHRRRKQHNPWTIEETQMLIKGVQICGEGHWADIKRLDFSELVHRSPVDLKDKWRNLLRLAQFSQNSRNRKVNLSSKTSFDCFSRRVRNAPICHLNCCSK